MSPQDVFDAVAIASVAVPCVMGVAALFLPKPRRLLLRSAIGMSVGWIADVAFTIYIYNPAGIAAGVGAGADNPEIRYDNNTVAVAIVGGWLYPALTIALALGLRALITISAYRGGLRSGANRS